MKAIDNHSVDAVVSTIVLCSVDEIQECFKEICRILTPVSNGHSMEYGARKSNINYPFIYITNVKLIGGKILLLGTCPGSQVLPRENSATFFWMPWHMAIFT